MPRDHVIIVGGANSAGQAAVYLSRYADKVTMADAATRCTSPCRRIYRTDLRDPNIMSA